MGIDGGRPIAITARTRTNLLSSFRDGTRRCCQKSTLETGWVTREGTNRNSRPPRLSVVLQGKRNMYEYPYLPGGHLHHTESLVYSPLQQRLRTLQGERLALIRMRLAAPSEAADGVEHRVQAITTSPYTLMSKFLNSIFFSVMLCYVNNFDMKECCL